MRPVFKQPAITLNQPRQMLWSIGLIARKQDHVLRPLYPLDRIHLHKPKLMNEPVEAVITQFHMGGRRHSLQMQNDVARL